MADTGAPFEIPYVEPTDLVRNYPAASEDLADAIADQFGLGFQFVGTRYYTSSGTFAKADPFGDSSFDGAKLRALRVTVQGGGGGGGGCATSGASQYAVAAGGAGGAAAIKFFDSTAIAGLPASVTVTRGAGGTGGSAGNNAGSAGGQSAFDTTTANGGGGGGGGGIGTVPGAGSFPVDGQSITANADFSLSGSPAAHGMGLKNATVGNAGAVGSNGGASPFGGAGRESSAAAGGSAGARGGGGGGAFGSGGDGQRAGEAGGNGFIQVDVFA